MVKGILAVSIIIFWLSFPFGIILMDSPDSFIEMDTSYYEDIDEPTAFNVFTNLWNFVKIYFQAMFLTMPNSNGIFTLLVVILQVVSGLVIYLLIREG